MRRILFVDRDGTLVTERKSLAEPVEQPLVAGVIPALLRLKGAGYQFAIVTNQPGLGEPENPRGPFEQADAKLMALLASQGIEFVGNFVCTHRPEAHCACRKPGIGLVRELVNAGPLDRERSAVVGDRDTDVELARNLGIQGYKLGTPGAENWEAVAHALVDRPRTATVSRRTKETDVRVTVDLDSEAEPRAKTGLGFFDHMLEQLGKHGGFKLDVQCAGDLHIDEHHTVEDVALTLGQALKAALGDKRGIQRYGFLLPMDEADAEVSIDLGGRPYLVFEAKFGREAVGENTHHMVEVCFKAVARALRQALKREGDELPTTKGQL
jgi:imidazoleglycerol-phosphate dehydratase/histidinol-phosphatase